MKVTFFIDRPVFSAVISIVIVIVGIIGLTMLPVDQYPQITPPVVKISASYPGASALTVSQAVATPIEQEINGTPGMLYMESNSSNSGGFSATVTFDVSADPDLAAVEIQNRVKLAESRLPADVTVEGIGRHGIVLQLGTLQVDGGEITIERRMKQGFKICAVDRAIDHQGVYLLFLVAQYLCQLAATGSRHLLPRELMVLIWGPLG